MSFCKRTLILIATSLFASFVTAWELSAEDPAKNTDSGTAVQRVTLDLKGLVKNWHFLPDNSKLDAIDQLIRQGRPEYAIQLLQQTSFQGAVARKRARFLRAMVLKTTGKYAAAVQEFRGLLANNPEFHRVRMELAHTLFLMKEDKSARHHFELVLGGSRGNPDLSRVVQSYLQAIGSRRRWDFSTYASIAPSTNFNQGSSNRTVQLNGLAFTLDETRVKKSGVGFVAGFQGSYRQPLSDRLDMIFSAGLHAKRFRESFFNDTLGNVSIGPRYRFNNGTLGVYATANKRRYANVDMTDGFGGIVTGSLRLSPSDIVFANVKCTKYIYNEDWRGTDLSYQDGHHCSVSGRFDHYLSDVMYVRALGRLSRITTWYFTLHASLSDKVRLQRCFPKYY